MTLIYQNPLLLLIPGLLTGLSLIFVAVVRRYLKEKRAVPAAVIVDNNTQ